MIKRLLCWLGFHSWDKDICARCGKISERRHVYSMMSDNLTYINNWFDNYFSEMTEEERKEWVKDFNENY